VCKIALRGLAACATARRDFAHAVGREPRGCTPYACDRFLNFQQVRGVAAKYLALVLGRQVQILDDGNACALEHLERRGIGAENEVIRPDGIECAARRRHVIAGRFQILR